MKQDEIKSAIAECRTAIISHQHIIEHYQSICSHENKKKGIWEERVGRMVEAIICEDCGKCIEYLLPPLKYTMTSTTSEKVFIEISQKTH